MPLYVRAGAMIPVDPVRQFTSQAVDQPTTIRIYGGADGSFTLYDDDGHTLGYQNGTDPRQVWIHFEWNDAARKLVITPGSQMKRWPVGMKRTFGIRLMGGHEGTSQVEFQGQRMELGMQGK
jgi:alpha-glucosidase/alpha-D-xyloside xylohydrolase